MSDLEKCCHQYKDKWLQRYVLEKCIDIKNVNQKKEFKDIWDSNKCDWENDSHLLVKYQSKYFKIWWDADKYNWEKQSAILAIYCTEHFNIWWDANKFNLEHLSYLKEYCLKYKDEWLQRYVIEKLKRTYN